MCGLTRHLFSQPDREPHAANDLSCPPEVRRSSRGELQDAAFSPLDSFEARMRAELSDDQIQSIRLYGFHEVLASRILRSR